MDFTNYIFPELLILVPVLWVIGMFLKNANTIDNRYIPAILGVVAVAISMCYVVGIDGFSWTALFTAITQGVMCAGAAVYGHQLIKQLGKNKEDNNDDER